MQKLFNTISLIFGFLNGLFLSFLGGWDELSICFLSFICIDYFSGVLKAIYNKELSSEIGYKGILKKVAMIVCVGIAVLLETKLGIPAIREIVISFFIANEGISILENIAQLGIDLPEKLKEILLQLRDKGDKNNE